MKTIEITEFPIKKKKKTKLSNHAYNSCLWFLNNYSKSTGELRQKLIDKGYPEESVEWVDDEGVIHKIDFIKETIDRLVDEGWADDARLANDLIDNYLAQGKAPSRIKMDLNRKKFDRELIEELFEVRDFEDEVKKSIEMHARRYINMTPYKKAVAENAYKGKQKLMQHLVGKGFGFGDINEVLEEIFEEE